MGDKKDKKHSAKRDEFTHQLTRAFSLGATFGVIRLIWKIIGVKSKASRRVGARIHFKQSLSSASQSKAVEMYVSGMSITR